MVYGRVWPLFSPFFGLVKNSHYIKDPLGCNRTHLSEQLGRPLIFKEGCHEKHKANCELPPRFEELQIEELQVSDLEQCGLVEGIEELLSSEECRHLQQELRTILFEERGFDVYIQGNHFDSFYSTSWEVISIQIHAWQGFSLVPPFEFHDKRHFIEFSLNLKVPFPKGFTQWGTRVPCISRGRNNA